MKRLHVIFSLIFFCYFLSSCSTFTKVVINGTPGTEIYSPTMERIATVQSDGTTTIKMDGNQYYAYLMSHVPNSQLFVPFALDYKRKSYTGTKISLGLGYTLAFCGLDIGLTGMLVSETAIAVSGLATLGVGFAFGFPAEQKKGLLQFKHRYEYLPYQTTNEDFTFVPIIDNGIKKADHINGNGGYALDAKAIDNSGTTVVKRNSSAARRKSVDFAQAVSGTYIGSGSLLLKGNTVESYSSIKVVIDRKAEHKVNVRVIESGESFFGSDLEYSVKRTDNGYELVLTGISNAVILIGHDGKLSFNHPKVNIDGGLYTLSISAGK